MKHELKKQLIAMKQTAWSGITKLRTKKPQPHDSVLLNCHLKQYEQLAELLNV